MDKSAVAQLVSELVQLLRPRNPVQADVVRDLGASVANDDMAAAATLFSSLEMWGGSGSVADVCLATPEANERMNELLVQLVEQFEASGVSYPRANGWASVFKEWQAQGAFRD